MSICSNVLHLFKKENNFQFCQIYDDKKQKGRKKFPPFFLFLYCWIQDPESEIRDERKSGSGIQDKQPGSALLLHKRLTFCIYILYSICLSCLVTVNFQIKKTHYNPEVCIGHVLVFSHEGWC
jgi:hypothetical protein